MPDLAELFREPKEFVQVDRLPDKSVHVQKLAADPIRSSMQSR